MSHRNVSSVVRLQMPTHPGFLPLLTFNLEDRGNVSFRTSIHVRTTPCLTPEAGKTHDYRCENLLFYRHVHYRVMTQFPTCLHAGFINRKFIMCSSRVRHRVTLRCVPQMATRRPQCPYDVTSPIYAPDSSIFTTNDSPTLAVKKQEFQDDMRRLVRIKRALHVRGACNLNVG
jgi:hypothetical protein